MYNNTIIVLNNLFLSFIEDNYKGNINNTKVVDIPILANALLYNLK